MNHRNKMKTKMKTFDKKELKKRFLDRKQPPLVIMVLAGFLMSALAFAQSNDDDENKDTPIQSEWNTGRYSVYSTGDKTFSVSLGGSFPLFFTDAHYKLLDNKMNIGGTGALSYAYYINPKVFVGGELELSFSSTLGEHFVFMVPITARLGYHFIYNRFEVPVSVSLGPAIEMYNGYNLLGMILKAQGALYYRFNSDWSFGLNTVLSWLPQWTKESTKNAYGHFLGVSVSARYHF